MKTTPTLNEMFEDFFVKWKKERQDWEAYVDQLYDPAKANLVRNFILDARLTPFNSVCNPEMAGFLFDNNGQEAFIRLDEPSMDRKKIHGEDNLFCSYFFQDPRDSAMVGSTVSVDVMAVRKPIPSELQRSLETLDFFADAIIDFETFEFPHSDCDSYYGPYSEEVKRLSRDLQRQNKEIAKEFRRTNSRLYRDIEKIHLKFAAGRHRAKKGEVSFIPVYIGFGTNEPYGLSFNGSLGKSRFMKWSFDSPESGLERGVLNEEPITLREFNERFNGMELNAVFYGKGYVIYSIRDERQTREYESQDDYSYDERRFNGFVKVRGRGKAQKGSLITPAFPFRGVSQEEYLGALVRNTPSRIPVIRTEGDIFNLLGDNLAKYEEFSSLQYDPLQIVRTFGMDATFKAVCTKLNGGEFCYADSMNVASDVYMIGTESFERLKISSLVIGNYIVTGKFRELLQATYDGKRIHPLFI